jgi:putative ABC transport system substrate-binding protein
MRRRAFVTGVAATVALLRPTHHIRAQAKVYRIGFLGGRYDPALWPSFLDGLREHGWEEGLNIVIEGRWTEGRPERYIELASELVSLKMDVIVAGAPPAVRALQQATRTTPIIMIAVADPVEMGFVKSFAEPGGNITGVTSVAGRNIILKLLELTKDALPSVKRVGILFNEGNPLNYITATAPQILAAAKPLELEILWLPIRTVGDLEPAIATAKQRGADAIIGSGDPLLFAQREFINETAERNGVPTIWGPREYLSGRGLLSYGPTFRGMLRQAAVYVDRILRGAKPATMPVEQPIRYDLVLNLKTAKALGLTIPAAFLSRADEVIE